MKILNYLEILCLEREAMFGPVTRYRFFNQVKGFLNLVAFLKNLGAFFCKGMSCFVRLSSHMVEGNGFEKTYLRFYISNNRTKYSSISISKFQLADGG